MLENKAGIRKAASRHIKDMKAKGETPTTDNVTHKIVKSWGFKVVRHMTGCSEDDVRQVVQGVIRNTV